MNCPSCGADIPVGNVGACLLEEKVPYIRCHVCLALLKVTLKTASEDELPDGWD